MEADDWSSAHGWQALSSLRVVFQLYVGAICSTEALASYVLRGWQKAVLRLIQAPGMTHVGFPLPRCSLSLRGLGSSKNKDHYSYVTG